jgi:hypothetical protein
MESAKGTVLLGDLQIQGREPGCKREPSMNRVILRTTNEEACGLFGQDAEYAGPGSNVRHVAGSHFNRQAGRLPYIRWKPLAEPPLHISCI